MCVRISLCTTVIHNTAQNSSDNLPPDNHHCSDVVYENRGGWAYDVSRVNFIVDSESRFRETCFLEAVIFTHWWSSSSILAVSTFIRTSLHSGESRPVTSRHNCTPAPSNKPTVYGRCPETTCKSSLTLSRHIPLIVSAIWHVRWPAFLPRDAMLARY